MQHGQGTATYRDGHVYHGGWKEGAEHVQGTFTLTLADGSKYVGQFKNNLPNGHGTYTFADGRIVEEGRPAEVLRNAGTDWLQAFIRRFKQAGLL